MLLQGYMDPPILRRFLAQGMRLISISGSIIAEETTVVALSLSCMFPSESVKQKAAWFGGVVGSIYRWPVFRRFGVYLKVTVITNYSCWPRA